MLMWYVQKMHTPLSITRTYYDMCKNCRVVNRSIRNMVNAEYDKFRERARYELSPVEIHFIDQFEAEQKRLKEFAPDLKERC